MMFHRKNGYETIECMMQRGNPVWEFSYPVEYRDRYGYSRPRASPVIAGTMFMLTA